MAQSNVVVETCINPLNTITTIQAGVAAASEGSTVLICPGIYPEQVKISKPLTLIGMELNNEGAVVIEPPTSAMNQTGSYLISFGSVEAVFPVYAQIYVDDTKGVALSNLTVDGSNNGLGSSACNDGDRLVGVYFENASGTASDILTQNQQDSSCTTSGIGIGIGAAVYSGPGDSSTVKVQDSSFRSWDEYGFFALGKGSDVTFRSSAVAGSGADSSEAGIEYLQATGTISDDTATYAVSFPFFAQALFPEDNDCGIELQQNSSPVTVSGNAIDNTQCGVALFTSDGNTISSNSIFDSQALGGIYVCGSGNNVTENTITDSFTASLGGITVSPRCPPTDDSSTPDNNDTISKNIINGAYIGISIDTSATGTQIKNDNEFFNVTTFLQQ